MSELKIIIELIRIVVLLIIWIFKAIAWLLRRLFQLVRGQPAAKRAEPARLATTARPGAAAAPRPAGATAPIPAPNPVALQQLQKRIDEVATRARRLLPRVLAQPLCRALVPTLRDFIVPRADELAGAARALTDGRQLPRLNGFLRYLELLLGAAEEMAEQRENADLNELIDDADALAEACYRPVVEFCAAKEIELRSNRVAALFAGDCSPALLRVGDPTGLAMLILPWSWMAEVQRWPAIGHEVGHDFYRSVDGLDDELVARLGLGRVRNGVALQYRPQGLAAEQLDGMVARWRDELVADAFGVLMLGPAYAVTTLSLFARPDDPREIVKIERDGDGQLEVHPPDHVRAAVVCRLLTRMGYGAIGERLEQRWRSQHGEPTRLYAPTPAGWWALEDEPIIARALQVGVTLYEDGYESLSGIPLRSMPGFDFGPREHQQALAVKEALLAGRRPQVRDARLLIAGAVLAWAERPAESVALLRAARLAVGTVALPVPRAASGRSARGSALGLDEDGLTADEVREGLLLDVILSPPRASQLRR